MTPDEFKAEVARLKKEVEYWKATCHKLQDENDRLALDLGLRDYPQWGVSNQGEQDALREQTPPVQEGMGPTAGTK
jgi:hypothetical protein